MADRTPASVQSDDRHRRGRMFAGLSGSQLLLSCFSRLGRADAAAMARIERAGRARDPFIALMPIRVDAPFLAPNRETILQYRTTKVLWRLSQSDWHRRRLRRHALAGLRRA